MKVLAPALRIYCVLLVLALVWIFFLGRLSWNLFVDVRVENLPRVILLTLGTSSSMVALSLYCGRNFLWAQQLEEEFAKILVPMKLWEITAIGLLSGIAEELFFRGMLYPAIKQAGFPRLAVWGVSLLFALVHFNLVSFVPLFVLAILLTLLYEHTDNLLAPIAAHALFNALNFGMLYLFEKQMTQ